MARIKTEVVSAAEVDGRIFPLTQLRAGKLSYYAAVWGDRFETARCIIAFVDDQPRVATIATISHGTVAYFDQFAEIELDTSAGDSPDLSRAAIAIIGELQKWSDNRSLPLRLEKTADGISLGEVSRYLLRCGANVELDFRGFVDLSQPEEKILNSFRKSTRKRLRDSKALLSSQTEVLDSTSEIAPGMAAIRELHLHLAGRETRPRSSWDVMEEDIARGFAQAILCRLEGELVSATYVRFGESLAEVATSVNRRDLFHLPLGYFPKWKAMLIAREKDIPSMLIDNLFPPTDSSGRKLERIAEFKRGFVETVDLIHRFYLP